MTVMAYTQAGLSRIFGDTEWQTRVRIIGSISSRTVVKVAPSPVVGTVVYSLSMERRGSNTPNCIYACYRRVLKY